MLSIYARYIILTQLASARVPVHVPRCIKILSGRKITKKPWCRLCVLGLSHCVWDVKFHMSRK